jgi:Prenyltransferase and squalene oxidase repeat
MAPLRLAQPRASRTVRLLFWVVLGEWLAGSTLAQVPEQGKPAAAFGESRRGDVPEGTVEMMTQETDQAIHRGLAWLARSQSPDGSFGAGAYKGNIAVTSLAGLAFMASGSSPGRGPYGAPIDKALDYVMQHTSPAGFIAVVQSTHGPMYSHGFGTLFLAEAYGMTHRPEIREKLQKAVRLIIDTQNIEGGWRYQPVRRDADLSVTICQINALRAARNAGLFVPKETVDACIRYVKQLQNADGGFRYMMQTGATSEFPRSAAGVVALQSAGEYDSREVRDGIAFLRQAANGHRPGRRNNHYFYGQYYAAQAMWLQGGEAWAKWYPATRDEMLVRQSASGSWSDGSVCDHYGTAMALIILQIPNDFLPIFQR